jgi:TRAP-type C4-dicarboxylate transport system permease small subunit
MQASMSRETDSVGLTVQEGGTTEGRETAPALSGCTGRLVQSIELIGGTCLAFVAVMGFVSVMMRYLFARPIPDAFDFSELLLGVIVFWGMASAVAHGTHIRMDAVAALVGKRTCQVMDIAAATIVFLFLVLFSYTLSGKIDESISSGESTFGLGVVVWPFHVAAALGIFVSVPLAFIRLWLNVRDRK